HAAMGPRTRPHRHRQTPHTRRAQARILAPELVRRLVSDACTERRHAEAWSAGGYRGAVERFRAEVSVRDGSISPRANHRIAGEAVPSRQLLGRMLLRGCGTLPPINLARAPGRAGC